jgi:alpha-1,2-rhamnosyltransferase
LTVSAIEPRKNYLSILSAAELLWQRGCQFHLVWVGKWTRDGEKEREYILHHPEYGGRLHVFNSVNDAELTFLYKNAVALIFASNIEGFGLPIVEAMQDGLPVILSNTSIHKEVAGSHAIYFDADDVLGLAELLIDVESDKSKLVRYTESPLSWSDSVAHLFESIPNMLE